MDYIWLGGRVLISTTIMVTPMSTRSVRLDDEAEEALADIISRTGLSISDAIIQGLIEYRKLALATAKRKPADFFKDIDLGDGGYSIGRARESKQALKSKLASKRQRRS